MADKKKRTLLIIGNPFGREFENPSDSGDKSSKDAAGYYPPVEGGFKCANCIFYIRGDGPGHGGVGKCKLVEGSIHPQGCCNLFEGPNKNYLREEEEEDASKE